MIPPERPRPSATGIPLVAGARVPLAFITAGLGALALAAIWLVAHPQALLLPHVHPEVVGLAHLWLPGFLLSVCIGAVYQLMPVVLGTPLRLDVRWTWIHLGLQVLGVALLVAGFRAGHFGRVALGGVGVSLGSLILATATWRTFAASARRDAVAWSFPLAASWLAGTAVFGLTLALNRRAPFLPLSVVDLLRAHAHTGLGGFFLTLLQGATFQLIPMFTMADVRRPRLVAAGLVVGQLGLAGLVVALAMPAVLPAPAAGLVLAAGILCTAVALRDTLATRRRRVLEPAVRAFVVGAVLVLVAAIGGLTLLFAAPVAGSATAYGAVVIAGALSAMVLGMLCKIVPFLIWMKAYGPRAGRQPVPQATALGSRLLERTWLALHLAGLAAIVAGLLGVSGLLVPAGALLLALGVGAFLANIARVMLHLIRPHPVATPAVLQPSPGR